MNWIIENISFISLILALINIFITLYNWYFKRPRLEFYNDGKQHFYITSTKEHRCYIGSKSIVFFYLKIANLSDLPCTISEFSLVVENKAPIYQRSNTIILEQYTLFQSDNNRSKLHSIYIPGKDIIKLPCTIPPLGYVEGYAIFPYAPEYKNVRMFAKLTAKTARKNFKTDGFISLYHANENELDSSVLL